MRFFVTLILAFSLFGCGYQPVAKITQNLIGENVFVDVIISKRDPQNTVAIKDSVRETIIKRLGRNLVPRKDADTIIIASISSLTFSSISSDIYGYTTAYKANLGVNYRVEFKDGSIKNIQTSGDYDFSVSKKIKNSNYSDSVISDTDRFNAIKNASEQSFDEFVSKLAMQGVKDVEHN